MKSRLPQANELIRPHASWLALGTSDEQRASAYRSLCEPNLDDAALTSLRETTESGRAWGSDRFKGDIERVTGRRMSAAKPGPKGKEAGEADGEQLGLDV